MGASDSRGRFSHLGSRLCVRPLQSFAVRSIHWPKGNELHCLPNNCVPFVAWSLPNERLHIGSVGVDARMRTLNLPFRCAFGSESCRCRLTFHARCVPFRLTRGVFFVLL